MVFIFNLQENKKWLGLYVVMYTILQVCDYFLVVVMLTQTHLSYWRIAVADANWSTSFPCSQ
jgi:hypothetical protein